MNLVADFSREAFASSDLNFSWSKTDEKHADLKNIFNTFELRSISDFAKRYELDTEYAEARGKLSRIINSFKEFGHPFRPSDIIPDFLLKDYISVRDSILLEACEEAEDSNSIDLVRFYTSSFFNLPSLLSKQIWTTEGIKLLDFCFSKNFRFKSKSGLNVFNMPKKERSKIIPQSDDHFLYSCDIKQFEFRTFLDIHPQISIPDSNDLYQYFAKKLGMTEDTCKISIISYLYGAKNEQLDSFFDKNQILPECNIFQYEDFFIFLDEDQDQNKIFHTIVQSISQFRLLRKIEKILTLLDDYDSIFLFPLHDELVFSLKKDEARDLIPKIRGIIVDEIYKTHEYLGLDYYNMRKL